MTEQEVIQGLKNSTLNFKDLTEFYDNEEVVLTAIDNIDRIFAYKNFEHSSTRLKDDLIFCLKAIKIKPQIIQFTSDNIKNNNKIILDVVKQHGSLFIYASETLRDDKEVVLAAFNTISKKSVRVLYTIFKAMSERLKNDITFFNELTDLGYDFFEISPHVIKNNKEIALRFLQTKTYNDYNAIDGLAHVSQELKSDKNFVLSSVSNNANCLVHASDELRNDRNVILTALTQLKLNFDANSPIENIFLNLMPMNPSIFKLAPECLRNKPSFVFTALQLDKNSCVYIGSELKIKTGQSLPISYLEKFLQYEKLEQSLPIKKTENKKVKI